jgi:hypothetical protein
VLNSTRRLILVTGAPRSGTTPIGQVLAQSPGVGMLYEPMGQSGDRRFTDPYPMAGEPSFDTEAFSGFLDDLRNLRLSFKPQIRPEPRKDSVGVSGGFRLRLIRAVFGTRSVHSFRLCRIRSPFLDTLLWKDPSAVLSAGAAADAGLKVIVCIRSPEAIAASYKRVGWVSKGREIFGRYRDRFGEAPAVERLLRSHSVATPVESASLLWHLIYRQILVDAARQPNILLVDPGRLEQDEEAEYRRLFHHVGIAPTDKVIAAIRSRTRSRRTGEGEQNPRNVHDWSRSIAETNSYWRRTLTDDEIGFVRELNSDVWSRLQDAFAAQAPKVAGSAPSLHRSA